MAGPPPLGRGLFLLVLVAGTLALSALPVSCESTTEMQDRLRKVFDEVLDNNPDLQLPEDLEKLQKANKKDKSRALADWALGTAGDKLEKWLGEGSSYLKDIKKALTAKNKASRGKAVQSALTKLFDKLVARLTKKGQTCQQALKEGVTPEVRLGHSPIKLFGYPVHVDGFTVLDRRLPLNKVNGFLVPIRVGAWDYYAQGRVGSVFSFFECFGDYEVIAETLFSDGHWGTEDKGKEKARPVYIQVQGVMEGGSVSQILTRAALHRVVKSIDFKLSKKGALTALVDAAVRGDLRPEDFVKGSGSKGLPLIGDLAAYANLGGGSLTDLVKEMNEADGFEKKFEVLVRFLRGPEDDVDGWTNRRAVHRQQRITVMITSYPRPDNSVRATLKMESNRVTLHEIKEALELIGFNYQ
ncbi:hypothetical protein ACSSS7_002042 [Eimeria intestinalis]